MSEQQKSFGGTHSFSKKIWIASCIILFCITFVLLFKMLISTIMLVLAGVLLAVYFIGLAHLIEKLKIPYKISIVLSVILNIAFLILFFWFIGARLEAQIGQLSDTLPKSIDQLKGKLDNTAIGRKTMELFHSSGDSQKTKVIIKKFFSSTFGVLSDIYIILLLSLFFVASPSMYKRGLIKLLPAKAQKKGIDILDLIHKKFKNWIIGKIVAFFFISIFTAVALYFLGMPLILTLALIAGVLNFIPNFGPIIALIPAVLLAFTIGTQIVIWVVVLYTVIQILQSALTQPLIQQRMVQVPPALVIFGQVALGLLAGFWGVLLATPIIVIIMTLINELYVKRKA